MITAHSGANYTKPNSLSFLNAVREGKIVADCFEVDVRYHKGKFFLSHMPTLFPNKKVPLVEALLLAKEKHLKINLDLKEFHTFSKVQDLVISLGMDEEVIYTGNTLPSDVPNLKAGVFYCNMQPFFKGLKPTPEDAKAIKKALEGYNNPRLRGININYRWTEPKFYQSAKDEGIPLSVYTLDDNMALYRLLPYDFENITTHHPDKARKYLEVTHD